MLDHWLVCLTLSYVIYRLYRKYTRPNDEPPDLPGALPIVGHAPLLMGDSKHLWRAVQEVSATTTKMGGVATVTIGPVTVYVITDPEDSTVVANTCLAKEGFYRFARPWLGNGLATAKLPVWKIHRKLLNPSFSPAVVDSFIQIFNEQAKRLVKSLEVEVDKEPFDHWNYTKIYALETICLTTLGVNLNDKPVIKEYLDTVEEMFEVLVKRFHNIFLHKTKYFNWTSLKKKQDELLEKIHQLDYAVLEAKTSNNNYGKNTPENYYSDTKGTKSKPFLDLLLEISTKKDIFTKQDIIDHIESMVLGGHDTSAAALMYIILLVGSYPRVQEKIFEELKEVFGDSDRPADKYDLTSLTYLEAVIKESLRLLPIAPIMSRNVDKNLKIRNYTLRAGRMCFISVYGINRHTVWGDDAHTFRPERWLDHATLPENPNAFAAFSMGRRFCIGRGYALMSLKITLSHILRHYRIEGDWTKMQLKVDVMLKSDGGHFITIKKR